jgi:hypothetical protein
MVRRGFHELFGAFALAFTFGCGASPDTDVAIDAVEDEALEASARTDAKAKAAVTAAARGLSYMSESDHAFVWVQSSARATAPANAAFVHRNFNWVTNGAPMADKPLSSLKSQTVSFDTFASRFAPVPGEDADLAAYKAHMARLLGAVRTNLKSPVVLRFGRPSGTNLVGAISVYVIGTLPSGKIGGVFTVAVET